MSAARPASERSPPLRCMPESARIPTAKAPREANVSHWISSASQGIRPCMRWPSLSVITPSFNQAQYIEQTIRSVLDNHYPALEYLVMDGGSTDGTVEILERHADHLQFVSQVDGGQSDAVNQGFARTQ